MTEVAILWQPLYFFRMYSIWKSEMLTQEQIPAEMHLFLAVIPIIFFLHERSPSTMNRHQIFLLLLCLNITIEWEITGTTDHRQNRQY